jgi:hypothetical protein
MTHSILIQCVRDDLNTEYARFTAKADRLEIMYLRQDENGVLSYSDGECIFFSDHPEAAKVHDGQAWNPVELMIWLISFEEPALPVARKQAEA